MLIRKPQVHIISREVTLATGELVRAFFAIINIEGSIEVKFLGTKPIESAVATQPEVLLLETVSTAVYGETRAPKIYDTVSPFYTLDFLTSQLARAPSNRL